MLTCQVDATSNATGGLSLVVENWNGKNTLDTAGAHSTAAVKSELVNDRTNLPAPAVKRRRKKEGTLLAGKPSASKDPRAASSRQQSRGIPVPPAAESMGDTPARGVAHAASIHQRVEEHHQRAR